MRIIIFFLLFSSFCKNAFSQKITGELEDKEIFSEVYIYIKDSLNKFVKEYYRIKSPVFEIKLKTTDQKVYFTVSAPGYRPFEQMVVFTDTGSVVEVGIIRMIKEEGKILDTAIVLAREKLYKEKNDTVFYDVSKFLKGNEMVVEDVLRNLPGMTVDEEGKIKFMGKPIEHVLVNGRNIFDEKYTLGTRNITADAIEGVEVLQDYHIEQILKDFNKGNTAINLRIKQSYFKTSGSVLSKLGIDQNAKLRQEQEAFALGIYNKAVFQLLTNYQNTSRVSQEHLNTNVSVLENDQYLQLIEPDNTIPSSYNSINNKLFSQQLNTSFDINEKITLKVKGSYRSDRLTNQSAIEKYSYIHTDTFYFKDEYAHTKRMRDYFVEGEVRYEINHNNIIKAVWKYLENENKHPFTISSQHANDIYTDIEQSYRHKYAKIDYLTKAGNFAYQTFIDFQEKEVNNRFFSSVFYYVGDTASDVQQNIRQKPFITRNKHELLFNTDFWQLSLSNEIRYTKERLNYSDNYLNNAFTGAFDFFDNDLKVEWRRHKSKVQYTGNLSYRYHHYKVPFLTGNKAHAYSTDQSLFASLNRHSISLGATASRNPLYFKRHYPFEIFRAQRASINYGMILQNQTGFSGRVSHTYKNRDRSLHIQNSFFYQYTNGIETSSLVITPASNSNNYVFVSDDINSLSFAHTGSKFIFKTKSLLHWSLNYHQGNQLFLLNQDLNRNNYKTLTGRIEIGFPLVKNFNIKYRNEYQFYQQESERAARLNLSSLFNTIQLDAVLMKVLELRSYMIYSIPDLNSGDNFSYWQANAEVNYKMKNKKWVIGMDFMNLFNEVNAQRTVITNYSRSVVTNQLVPRMALLKVRFIY
jgi:hypothetical protein